MVLAPRAAQRVTAVAASGNCRGRCGRQGSGRPTRRRCTTRRTRTRQRWRRTSSTAIAWPSWRGRARCMRASRRCSPGGTGRFGKSTASSAASGPPAATLPCRRLGLRLFVPPRGSRMARVASKAAGARGGARVRCCGAKERARTEVRERRSGRGKGRERRRRECRIWTAFLSPSTCRRRRRTLITPRRRRDSSLSRRSFACRSSSTFGIHTYAGAAEIVGNRQAAGAPYFVCCETVCCWR